MSEREMDPMSEDGIGVNAEHQALIDAKTAAWEAFKADPAVEAAYDDAVRAESDWSQAHWPEVMAANGVREYTFTTSATFTAASEQEAWDEYIEWLTEPMHVEDGTETVVMIIPGTEGQITGSLGSVLMIDDDGVATVDGVPLDAWVSPIPDASGNASEITDLGDEGQDRESYTDTQDRDNYEVDEEQEYDVVIRNTFNAINPQGAVQQMVDYLTDSAGEAEYKVERYEDGESEPAQEWWVTP